MSEIVVEMDRAQRAFDDPTLTLLHQPEARVVTAVFNACFSREVRAIPVDRMHTLVDQMLDDLRGSEFADQVPDKSARALCAHWVKRLWLDRDIGDDGDVYSLRSDAMAAMSTVRSLNSVRTSVSQHEIAALVNAVRDLNAKANPDPLAQLEALERQRDEVEAKIAHLREGKLARPSDELLLEGFLDLQDRIARLPRDFERVQESLVSQRNHFLEQFHTAGRTAGEVVGDFIDQAAALMDTPPGRAFQGALELLRDTAMGEQLRSDMEGLLALPVAGEVLTPAERAELAGVARTLVSGVADVVARRQRVTAVLSQNIRTRGGEDDSRLETVLRLLDQALPDWLARTGPRTSVPLELVPRRPAIAHLRERMHDPRDDVPLAAGALAPGAAPQAMTLEQMRALGGPQMDVLRECLGAAWEHDPDASLADVFASLPPDTRRPADLYGALQVAVERGMRPSGGSEHFQTLRPDGTARVWALPRLELPPADAPATDRHDNLLANVLDELEKESA